MTTFEQVLDLATELPLDQQELLIEIMQRRTVDWRRQELADSSREALSEFKTGNLKVQTADEAISELRTYLSTPDLE